MTLGSYNTLEVDDLLEVNQGELMRYVISVSGQVFALILTVITQNFCDVYLGYNYILVFKEKQTTCKI